MKKKPSSFKKNNPKIDFLWSGIMESQWSNFFWPFMGTISLRWFAFLMLIIWSHESDYKPDYGRNQIDSWWNCY